MKNCYNFAQILAVICACFEPGNLCTFDSGLVGTWESNAYGTITVTSTTFKLGSHTFYINGATASTWTCHNNETSPYVILRSVLFQQNGFDTYAYMCLTFTQVNGNSYYYYMNSPKTTTFSNDRIMSFSATATPGSLATSICTELPAAQEFISIVRIGSQSQALTNCPDPLYGNFTYIFNKGGSILCTSNSFVSVCPDRQNLVLDYTKCSEKIGASGGGHIGCVASKYDAATGTWYASVYNFDTAVNDLTTFRFTCWAVEAVYTGVVRASYAIKRCHGSLSYTNASSITPHLSLTPNGTCENTYTTLALTTTTTVATPNTTTDMKNIGNVIGRDGGIITLIVLVMMYFAIKQTQGNM